MSSEAKLDAAQQSAKAAGPPARRREQKRGKIGRLPAALRTELEKKFEQNGFGDYRGLSAWLAEQGYEISPSSLNYYAHKFEQRLAAVRLATMQARAIAEAVPEGDDHLTRALTRMVQSTLFDTLVELHDAREKFRTAERARAVSSKRLARAAKSKGQARAAAAEGAADVAKYPSKAELDAVNSLGRTVASIGKLELQWAKWMAQARERVKNNVAAANQRVSEAVAEGGLSPEAEARIRAALLEIKV